MLIQPPPSYSKIQIWDVSKSLGLDCCLCPLKTNLAMAETQDRTCMGWGLENVVIWKKIQQFQLLMW